MRIHFCLMFLVLTITQSIEAAVYTILPDGSGDFPTVQAAVEAAEEGDLIQLSDGTFRGPGNRDIDFMGKNITIASLSGNPQVCIIDCELRGRGFRFANGEGSTAVLRGVTMTNGNADGSWPDNCGGGAYVGDATPTFERCVFYDNMAGRAGGAIYCSDAAVTLDQCLFDWNRTNLGGGSRGGAIACWNSTASVVDCTFNLCASSLGGHLHLQLDSSATLENCTLMFGVCGGVYCDRSTISIDGCTLCYSTIVLANGSDAHVTHSIVALSYDPAVECMDVGSFAMLTCCDVFGNSGGNWVGCIENQFGQDGNICADPLFCDPDNLDYTLQSDSPCAQSNNPECGQIGSLPIGCGATRTMPMSWGALKALFRASPGRSRP